MIIKRIEITRSKAFEKYETNFETLSHIYSLNNSQGKTTLIRFIIYGLGFNVPITNNISPNGYTVRLFLEINGISHQLVRNNKTINWISGQDVVTYSVKVNNVELLKKIFNCDNADLLSNLLGTFYIDQESGWVVFNRGKVIGKIDYNIDKIIFSLSGLDGSLFMKRKVINSEVQGYRDIFNLLDVQESLKDYGHQEEPLDEKISELQQKISLLKLDLINLKKERKSYLDLVNQNKRMWDYIDSLKISVVDGDRRIRITKENIEGLIDAQDYHRALIHKLDIQIANAESDLSKFQSIINELLAKQDVDNEIYILGARHSITIDKKTSKKNMDILLTHAKNIEKEIESAMADKPFKNDLNEKLTQYAQQLGIYEDLDKEQMITKRVFHDYAGTIKQKMVLAYRCAALTIVSQYLGIKLPIIIDSMNRDTDKDNMELLIAFLRKEFGSHQIIISTIMDIDAGASKIAVTKPLIKKYSPSEYLGAISFDDNASNFK